MPFGIQSSDAIKTKVKEHVPEPVLAVGMVQPAGTWGAFGLGRLSPAGGMLKQRGANKRAGVLSRKGAFYKPGKSPNAQTVIALTADKLYAFDARYGWGGIKIKDQLACWDRKDLTVTLEKGSMATKITFRHTDGTEEEVEASTAFGTSFNDDLLTELAK